MKLNEYKNKSKPQIYDYAIVSSLINKNDHPLLEPSFDPEFKKFIGTNICNITKKIDNFEQNNRNAYQIEYDTVPPKFKYLFEEYFWEKNIATPARLYNSIRYIRKENSKITYRRWIPEENIFFYSHNKEDVDTYVDAIKYNL